MSCSFCHFAGHKVTTCQSTVLLDIMTELRTKVEEQKKSCITTLTANPEYLFNTLNVRSTSMLKGIAAKCGIRIRKNTRRTLMCLIIMNLYYNNTPAGRTIQEILFFQHLNRVVRETELMQSLTHYKNECSRYRRAICVEILNYNIECMRREGEAFMHQLVQDSHISLMMRIQRHPDTWIPRTFGMFVTEQHVRLHMPRLFDYINEMDDLLIENLISSFQNEEEAEEGEVREERRQFTDVVLRQKLTIHCEYKADAVCEETAEECIICCDNVKCNTVLNCGHMFCIVCTTTTLEMTTKDHRMKAKCSACRAEIKNICCTDFEKINKLSEYLA